MQEQPGYDYRAVLGEHQKDIETKIGHYRCHQRKDAKWRNLHDQVHHRYHDIVDTLEEAHDCSAPLGWNQRQTEPRQQSKEDDLEHLPIG